MNFSVAPDRFQKLSLLDGAARFEPAGSEPLEESDASPRRTPKPLPCISSVTTPRGKVPVLKAMMTTACERNCYYCPFQAGRHQTRRITFTPDEMAATFVQVACRGVVEGLFLSSGIIQGSVSSQDKIIDTAEIIRRKHGYRGYLHLKIMPGAEYDQVRRTMELGDRVSVNLEGPTAERLSALAPKKDYWTELITRLQWIGQIRRTHHLRTSVVTQFVVGAVGDTDLELLQVSERLYRQFGLRRAYYSAFSPIADTPFEHLAPTVPLRQFRLYQASFLLRDYGWNLEDLPFQSDTNLPLQQDPKRAWAEEHLRAAPLEINLATRLELLRVPGIGPAGADAIVQARRRGTLRTLSDLRSIGVRQVDRAAPFILLNGCAPYRQLALL